MGQSHVIQNRNTPRKRISGLDVSIHAKLSLLSQEPFVRLFYNIDKAYAQFLLTN